MPSIKLGSIPENSYSDYRYNVIFKAYKWDPQVEDYSTISNHVVLMPREIAIELESLAEKLSEETMKMEALLVKKPELAKKLGLPKEIYRTLGRLSDYNPRQHIRLMRFDFHPTTTGWAVSEVNSDVPGGLAEASVLPQIAECYFEGYEPRKNVADSLLKAFQDQIGQSGRLAFVHATSYSDDRQVMQFLSDYLTAKGYSSVMAAPDHIRWINKKAVSIVEGCEGPVDGIIRFFPLEWLVNLPGKSNWQAYYDGTTPACNPPSAIFAQSKRLPLIWDELELPLPVWKALLPETVEPGSQKFKGKATDAEWIYKPALGRVGEGISIKEAITAKELKQIEKSARRYPKNWLLQRRFNSLPITCEKGDAYHLCIGVFTVNGKCAGFYGRTSPQPRIDAKAKDIPVLVSKSYLKEGITNEGQPGNL